MSALYRSPLGGGSGVPRRRGPDWSPDCRERVPGGRRRWIPGRPGVVGELLIAGDAVSDGYVGLPKLTAEKFAPLPWDAKNRTWYRTGDCVSACPVVSSCFWSG